MLLDLSRNEGKTIFLSSHNLDEMQRLCNRIVLIHGGETKLYGDLEQLARGSGRGGVVSRDLRSHPGRGAGAVAAGDRGGRRIPGGRGGDALGRAPGFEVPAVVAFLVQHGVRIEQVTKQQDSLEDLYLRIEAEARAAGGDRAAGPRRRPAREGEGPRNV